MDEELDLNLEEDNNEDITRRNKRIKSLSEKVKEKDTLLAQEAEARKKAEDERASAAKERDFYKNFNQVSTKYQGASEYQDKILEKVNAGYDVEDATISILAKEGKLTQAPAPAPEIESAAGGSAATSLQGGSKSLEEMSREEKRQALADLESQGNLKL